MSKMGWKVLGRMFKTCGTGEKTRTVECKRGNTVVSDNECTERKPETETSCNTQACEEWEVVENKVC